MRIDNVAGIEIRRTLCMEALKMQASWKALMVPVVAGMLAAGCASDGSGQKETMGTLIGAGLGAWAGSTIGHGGGRVVATAVGTMVGAGIGNAIGKNMDKVDQMEMERAQYNAFEYTPSGTSTDWYNPDTGNSGAVTPEPAYKNTQGQYCREFQQKVTINGQQQDAYGTACRKPDGSWEIVSS